MRKSYRHISGFQTPIALYKPDGHRLEFLLIDDRVPFIIRRGVDRQLQVCIAPKHLKLYQDTTDTYRGFEVYPCCGYRYPKLGYMLQMCIVSAFPTSFKDTTDINRGL